MDADLQLHSLIAFNALTKDGLQPQPGSDNFLFTAGNTLIVQNGKTRAQQFLKGHLHEIHCLAVSRCGGLAATAERRDPGFVSEIIVWDLAGLQRLASFKMHKGSVKRLAFSPKGSFLASAGSLEDKNRLIVWELQTEKPAYCLSLGLTEVRDLAFFTGSEEQLVAATDASVQILSLNSKDRKIDGLTCNVGNLKRSFSCLAISPDDQFLYAGTKTGDVIEIMVERGIMKKIGPCGKLFEHGVKVLAFAPTPGGEPVLLVGSGDGRVTGLCLATMKRTAGCELEGPVSSLAPGSAPRTFLCGTEIGNIYLLEQTPAGLTSTLKESGHVGRVNAVCFPKDFSEVFATCGREQIRVWALRRRQELLRICVAKAECFCLAFSDDGKVIVSGWSDGKIRAFYPQSGKLMWVVEDAHAHGVTALAATPAFDQVITGGMEGEIRLWKVTKNLRTLENSLKEHRGRVWAMRLREGTGELVSCSADGSCVIWDLRSHARVICIFDKTIFKNVVFHPDGSQLVTVGSDTKITYWSSFEGEAIRVLEGSEEETELAALDIARRGNFLITGGQDNALRVWSYHEGKCLDKRVGHCGGVLNARISPDEAFVVSTGTEGDIAIWSISERVRGTK